MVTSSPGDDAGDDDVMLPLVGAGGNRRTNEDMLPDRYLEDFLRGLESLSGVYPDEARAIASHGVVVALDDDEAFVVLLQLVGPEAPVFADELWQLISAFLNSRRADELFGGPEGIGRTHLNAVRRPRYIPPSTRPVIRR